MSKLRVQSQKDLYALKQISQAYDEVVIDLHQLKTQGLIRHAVKYGINALRSNGLLVIETSPFQSYVLRRNKVDFWQVKYEVFGCLRDTIEVVEVNAKEGRLVLKKTKHVYDYNGVSFGIVFSGNKEEEEYLTAAITSIASNKKLQNLQHEVLICGPESYDISKLQNQFSTLKLKYLPLEISTSPRLMICDKKNFIYSSAQYSLVVISHCRILFSENFVDGLLKFPIEMATPAVYFADGNKEYKYLDMGFIDTYQDMQFGAKRGTVAGENINDDYLHWYRRRVPFIDGGLNVFNKNVIPDPPYNKFISWGEAEDVDVCNTLFQKGILIDYLPGVKCYSATCKVTGYNNNLKKIARRFHNYINKKGF